MHTAFVSKLVIFISKSEADLAEKCIYWSNVQIHFLVNLRDVTPLSKFFRNVIKKVVVLKHFLKSQLFLSCICIKFLVLLVKVCMHAYYTEHFILISGLFCQYST